MTPRPLRWCDHVLARALHGALAALLAVLASGAFTLAPRAIVNTPATWCCCAVTGVDARCSCAGDCCRHEPVPVVCGESPTSEPPAGVACLATTCRRPDGIATTIVTLGPFVAPAPLQCGVARRSVAFTPAVARRAPQLRWPAPERPPDPAIA